MRKRLLLIFATTAVLTACGGGGGGGSDSGDRVALAAAGSATPVPGNGTTDLDFTLTNPSSVAAQNVALFVTLGTGLVRSAVSCTASNGATCPASPESMTVPTLPAGGTLRFRVAALVGAGTSGAMSASATVTATNDQVASNNSAQISLTAYSTDVSIFGSASANEYFSGSSVPYSFVVSNSGPDTARDVSLQSTSSAGQTVLSITCAASGGATCPSTAAPTMTIPVLVSGGSLAFTVTTQLSMTAVGVVSNTLAATSLGDSNTGNDSAAIAVAARSPTSSGSPSFVLLQSDPGDYIGLGHHYTYTNENAVFQVQTTGDQLMVFTHGDEDWHAIFDIPGNASQLTTGRFEDRRGPPTFDLASAWLNWSGEGRGCTHTGWFEIDEVVYAGGALSSIDLRFEQHCDGLAPALHGQIHWDANDATRPPGPVNPPPAGLWQPAPGATPASGNFVYIESDANDFIGQGRTETYTQSNAVLVVTESGGELFVGSAGNRNYVGEFTAMVPLTQMAPGYYPNAQISRHGNPAVGRFSFTGDGRGCNVLTGWFVVDSIAFVNGAVSAVDVRFEQHCEGRTPALRGRIHWRSDDPTQPPGPVVPPPAGLWTPPANAIPATGNAIYLQSDPSDYIGQGLVKLYTPLDTVFEIGGGGMTSVGNRFQLAVRGDEEWSGFFQAMNTLPDLRAGYYGNLQRFPMNNPTAGGVSWSGEARGCNELSGWFVVDSVAYTGSTLTSIQLRFEQHCEHQAAALRGFLRWSAADTRPPSPPVVPPPANLWQPPGGATPASGNYLYLRSEPGDFIGQGRTYLYTMLNSVFVLSTLGSQLNLETFGDEHWNAYFQPMVPLTQLAPGYYDLANGDNIAKGGLNWSGEGRGCGAPRGWFVVDAVTYSAGMPTVIDLRFEQRCGVDPPLHGKLHWRADDPTQPPGPQTPPQNLWSPPAGSTPASGNFFYVKSDAGDYVGQGVTALFTPATSTFQNQTFPNEFRIGVVGPTGDWSAGFDRMSSIPRLQPGYYPNVQGLLRHNPTVAGLDVMGAGRGCDSDQVSGWFVIHAVTYTGTDVTAIDATFEQHCGGATAALRGRVRWGY